MEYKDIEVEVTDPKRERTADKKWMGHFKVRVLHSEAGEMADTEAVPVQYDLKELRTGLKRLEKRKLDREGLIDLGLTLAMLLLPPGEQGSPSNVRGLFAESLNLAGQDAGLTFCHKCLREEGWYNRHRRLSGGVSFMAQEMAGQGPFAEYLGHFDGLIGDRRTGRTLGEIVRGIINAGSLVCQQIAAHSAELSVVKEGAQRVIRFAKGKSTKRSQVDAEHLTAALCERGVAQLAESETDELWLIADPSDLRKPYASEMPDLMQVKDLDGKLVPGYRTLNVLGVTPGRRGILYHRLFSSVAEDFDSEPLEVQRGLKTVSQAVRSLKERMAVSWIVDRGFDDVAVWRTIWEQEEHVVCRLFHSERLVAYQTVDGKWMEGDVVAAQQHLRPMASARTEMVVRYARQFSAAEPRTFPHFRLGQEQGR